MMQRSSIPVVASDAVSAERALVARLRAVALEGLGPMYQRDRGLFVFRLRLRGSRLVREGQSIRYTAITLLGLAGEDQRTTAGILVGTSAADACGALVRDIGRVANLGDLALICWAAAALDCRDRAAAFARLVSAEPDVRTCTTVELAWSLSALCSDHTRQLAGIRERVATRLMRQFHEEAHCFPHATPRRAGWRTHVACFADQVYPILALSQYTDVTGDGRALDIAADAARHLCRVQGPAGQWWWHYDTRGPRVVESYPVYSVHQDGMAPMALLALQRVAHIDFAESIARGLRWLVSAPEIGGQSLIDDRHGVIWRKVGRRERAKASRYLQAIATRVKPGASWPGLGLLFPPGVIDFECRPYHLGWLLYAWPAGWSGGSLGSRPIAGMSA